MYQISRILYVISGGILNPSPGNGLVARISLNTYYYKYVRSYDNSDHNFQGCPDA